MWINRQKYNKLVLENETIKHRDESEEKRFLETIQWCERKNPVGYERAKGFGHKDISRSTLFSVVVDLSCKKKP